jgi:SAM-dependent methyltransferase
MNQSGWTCKGLEPDPKARELCQSNYRLDVSAPEELFNLPGQFDVITMWHVLEHVHQLDDYMQALMRLLKDDGLLVIALPNFDSLDGHHYGQAWDGYDVPRHLYHFHPASLRALAERSGFELTDVRPMPFDPFYLAILSERHKRFDGALHKASRGNVVSAAIVGGMSWLKAKLNKNKGSSITYLLKKKG